MRLTLFLLLLILGCGSERVDPIPPNNRVSQELMAQISRIENQLLFCRGMPTGLYPHHLNRRANCDTGDGMLWSGLYALSNPDNMEEIDAAIRYSIDEDGRPWRSPESRDFGEHVNSFSRDMFKGLMLYLIRTKDQTTAKRFLGYVERNDYRMCPLATDSRCIMTPATLELFGDVLEFIGLPRPIEMPPLGFLSEAVSQMEALVNPPGYRLHLITMGILIKTLTGNLTQQYSDIAYLIYARQNQNLWYRFLANYTSYGYQEEYEEICRLLVERMKAWPGSEVNAWVWQNDQDSEGFYKSKGHDLVWLAKMLIYNIDY